MAVKFQYNKTSLTELGKQLKVRQRALPTLQNKESALRLEVRKAKEESSRLYSHNGRGPLHQEGCGRKDPGPW